MAPRTRCGPPGGVRERTDLTGIATSAPRRVRELDRARFQPQPFCLVTLGIVRTLPCDHGVPLRHRFTLLQKGAAVGGIGGALRRELRSVPVDVERLSAAVVPG